MRIATGCAPTASPSTWKKPLSSVSAVRGDLTVDVLARGELESTNASPIAVPRVPTGALKVKELVEEGLLVEEGDVVVVFDDSELNIELDGHLAA